MTQRTNFFFEGESLTLKFRVIKARGGAKA